MTAAKERTAALPSPALIASGCEGTLPGTRVWRSDFEKQAFTRASRRLSSTSRWGCGYRCDGTTVVSSDQRFYASSYGRFNSTDPFRAGGASSGTVNNPSDPVSWNRYAYTRGDPVNRIDPQGTCDYGANGFLGDPTCLCDPDLNSCDGAGWGPEPCIQDCVLPTGATPPPSITCFGTARILQGNAATIGHVGGLPPVTITGSGAAIIPSQWIGGSPGQSGPYPTLAPWAGYIAGVSTTPGASFNGVVDVVGGAPPAGFPPDSNVRDDLVAKYPGQLIIELPGASKDSGSVQIFCLVGEICG